MNSKCRLDCGRCGIELEADTKNELIETLTSHYRRRHGLPTHAIIGESGDIEDTDDDPKIRTDGGVDEGGNGRLCNHELGKRRTRDKGSIVYWQCRKCGRYVGFW